MFTLVDQDLDVRVWAANRAQQIKLRFEPVGTYFGFELLARPIGENTKNFDGHEIVIRDRKDTIALANVIKIHDEGYWSKTQHENLEINGEPIQLWNVFEQPEVRSRLSLAQSAKSDFITVGLASNSVEAVSADAAKTLSNERARTLGIALLSYAGLNIRRSDFHAIGLGEASELTSGPESPKARDQRSAVILAITRRHDTSQILDLDRITEALVQNYKTERINLSNYEYSDDIARQLASSIIDFAGYL